MLCVICVRAQAANVTSSAVSWFYPLIIETEMKCCRKIFGARIILAWFCFLPLFFFNENTDSSSSPTCLIWLGRSLDALLAHVVGRVLLHDQRCFFCYAVYCLLVQSYPYFIYSCLFLVVVVLYSTSRQILREVSWIGRRDVRNIFQPRVPTVTRWMDGWMD